MRALCRLPVWPQFHKITANNEESDNKRKERIGEGGNGWVREVIRGKGGERKGEEGN